jgi:predicted metalloprotease
MRWGGLRRSTNVEDRRGMGGGGMAIGGGIGGIVLLLVGAFLGVDLTGLAGGGGGAPQQQGPPPPADDPKSEFVVAILGSTEDVWNGIFRQQLQRDYQEPKLVIFSRATGTACGTGQSAMGPFYCPPDQGVYIDLSFYEDMKTQLGAPGDFAQAYVIAHEVGHHVQNLLGVSDQVHQAQQSAGSRADANALSVALELQADCFAGVWGYHANAQRTQTGEALLESGDVEEALNAASAIGDDRLQSRAQGQVVPESFTHGSSAQRVQWFKRGFTTGDMKQCDTFNSGSF